MITLNQMLAMESGLRNWAHSAQLVLRKYPLANQKVLDAANITDIICSARIKLIHFYMQRLRKSQSYKDDPDFFKGS